MCTYLELEIYIYMILNDSRNYAKFFNYLILDKYAKNI